MDDLISFNSPDLLLTNTPKTPKPPNRDVAETLFQCTPKSVFSPAASAAKTAVKSAFEKNFPVVDFERQSARLLSPFLDRNKALLANNCSDLDAGRESLGILNVSRLEGLGERDSFGAGTFNLNDLSLGRESLGILNLNGLDLGRKSLGILNLNNLDLSWRCLGLSDLPDVSVTDSQTSKQSNRPLDTAFLLPSNKTSISSGTSLCVNPSFNSESLEGSEFSRIVSVSSTDGAHIGHYNPFDTTRYNASEFLRKLRSVGHETPSIPSSKVDSNSGHARACSLPSVLQENNKPDAKETDLDVAVYNDSLENSVFVESHHGAFGGADGSILDHSINENDLLDNTTEPDDLHNNISECEEPEPISKCDTETIFKTVDKMLPPSQIILRKKDTNLKLFAVKNDHSDNGSRISQPQKPHNISNLCDNLENSKESVESPKNPETNSCDKLALEEQLVKHPTESLFRNVNVNNGKSSKSTSSVILSNEEDPRSSRDSTKQILNGLRAILSNANLSDSQKSNGNNLLDCMANILDSNNAEISRRSNIPQDDSGHSSIIEAETEMWDNRNRGPPSEPSPKCFEVLDLRLPKTDDEEAAPPTTTSSPEDCCTPLDLSINSKNSKTESQLLANDSIRRKSSLGSISFGSARRSGSSLAATSSNASGMSFGNRSATSSVPMFHQPSVDNKFKPKKPDERLSSLRKGPMKATVPVNGVEQRKSVSMVAQGTTLTRSESRPSSLLKIKKTSPHVNELRLKPMAQSTPENNVSKPSARTESIGRRKSCLPSPVDLRLKNTKTKLNYSESLTPTKEESQMPSSPLLNRLNSLDDLKKIQTTPKTRLLRRSTSVGGILTGTGNNKFGANAGAANKAVPFQRSLLRKSFDGHSATQKNSTLNNSKKPVLSENRFKLTAPRPLALRKSGKENSLV